MGSIWVREFTGGLDTRRLPETTPGGTLLTARNGHITRGGEFEQRAAIQKAYDLPPNTFGLAYQQGALFIFAETDPGGALDSDIGFFEIKHPDGITNPARVLSWDLFAGLIYASVRFADDSVYHFYNLNQRIDIWFDGKARASFTVTGGTDATASAAASGSFDITAVLSTGSVTVSHIYIGTKDLLASPVVFATSGGVSAVLDRGLLATALANAIAANSGSSGYTATAASSKVVVTATTAGPAPNRLEILPSYSTSEVTMTIGVMGGGTDALSGSVTSVKIDGVESLSAPVVHTGTPESMAAALAAAMDANAATTHFDVTSDGATVTIAADTGGTAANGKFVQIAASSGMTFSPASIVTAGGYSGDVLPGSFVKTLGKKVHSISGSVLYFSGIAQPTEWSTDAVGAGFIDMSTEAAGSDELVAVARYQNYAAIFAETTIQIWYLDPDPTLNRWVQTLENTGVVSGKSVTQYGDNDLFYLADSGVRSLRARAGTDSASTTDIGVPIDTLIVEKLATLNNAEKSRVIGLIEPKDGRLWIIMKDVAYVFSYFANSKISAWSVYDLTWIDEDGETQTLAVTDAVVFKKKIYLRSGDAIFVYGGTGDAFVYDATEAEAWLPYLDANDPTREKEFNGIDVTMRGDWRIGASFNPHRSDEEEHIAEVTRTTFQGGRVPFEKSGNVVSLRFRSMGAGPHKLGSLVLTFTGDADED